VNFKTLVKRYGIKAIAGRLGLTESTIKRWLRRGVSTTGKGSVKKLVKRIKAAKKSAKTRKYIDSIARNLIPPPSPVADLKDEDEGLLLTDEQVLPTRPPIKGVQKPGLYKIKSTSYSRGETRWIKISQQIPVNHEEITNLAGDIFKQSGRQYCSVKLLFFRYIPFNPLYTGAMLKLAGTWVDQYVSTYAASAPLTVGRYTSELLSQAEGWSENRVIFLDSIGVSTFDKLRDLTAEDIANEELHE
jgi:hypothetical protein